MPAGIDPIFTNIPDSQWGVAVLVGNNNMDGTGTVTTICTADTNGAFIGEISLKPLGTNVMTVARFFLNNGLTNATAANNVLIDEISCPATTASVTASLPKLGINYGKAIKAGYKINMTLSTSVVAGWIASVEIGQY